MAETIQAAMPGSETASGAGNHPFYSKRSLLWIGIALLAAGGCLGIYRQITDLWTFWTTDPLRSIGMLIPPVSVALTLRVWHRHGWELRGTWWGLPVIGLAFLLSVLRDKVVVLGVVGTGAVSFLPLSLPVYVYGSGIILLFAGVRVWRKAWFPLGLLLLSQPVPVLTSFSIDIRLQEISARVARSFATMIGFAPTTPQLRLMFSPDFGMFIAPGCDGIRGAVTMGYVALVLGYLKRVSMLRWVAYVSSGVLLGYLFNFIRLCTLVVYYRIALGHPSLEGAAKWADYAIGSCLFLSAALLFFWLAQQKPGDEAPVAPVKAENTSRSGMVWMKCAAFAVLLAAALSVSASSFRTIHHGAVTPALLAARMPKQVGEFKLTRTWYEQKDGSILLEAGAYSAPGSDEITLAVSVAPTFDLHDANICWQARGLKPELLARPQFTTGNREQVALETAFYSDGITDSIIVNAICTPSSCAQFQRAASGSKVGLLFLRPKLQILSKPEDHAVSMVVRVDKLQSNIPKTVDYNLLSAEAQRFIAGLDLLNLSKNFQ